MKKLIEEMHENSNSWPFIKPVSGVQDYYDVIKYPMGTVHLTKICKH
jgi:hypothetical protein